MDQMGAVNSELEELFQDKKRVRNPLVPIGKFLIPKMINVFSILFLLLLAIKGFLLFFFGKSYVILC